MKIVELIDENGDYTKAIHAMIEFESLLPIRYSELFETCIYISRGVFLFLLEKKYSDGSFFDENTQIQTDTLFKRKYSIDENLKGLEIKFVLQRKTT